MVRNKINSKNCFRNISNYLEKDNRVFVLNFTDNKHYNKSYISNFFESNFKIKEITIFNSKKAFEVDRVFLENEIRKNGFDYIVLVCKKLDERYKNLEKIYKKLVKIIDCLCENKTEFMILGDSNDLILYKILRDYNKLINKKDKKIIWNFYNKCENSLFNILPNFLARIVTKNFIFSVFKNNNYSLTGAELFTNKILRIFKRNKVNIAVNNLKKNKFYK